MTKIEQTVNLMKEENTFKRYEDGDHKYKDFSKQIFNDIKIKILITSHVEMKIIFTIHLILGLQLMNSTKCIH